MKDLKQKSIDGVIWNLLEKFGVQFIKLVLGVILARILTPADYGLIGMITIFIAISTIFIDSGFGLAYIQKKDATDEDASTIFYFNLLVSIICFLLLWFFAPYIAQFYNESQLVDLVRVLGLVLIVNAFSLIQVSQLSRNVDFKKKTILMVISAVLSGGAGIGAALMGYGVWSLVIQRLAKSFIESVGLWWLYNWRPKIVFSISSLKSMFSFSSWALFLGLLTAIFDNIYYVVIGKFFPAALLGFYTKGKQFQQTLTQTPSFAVGAVAFPVFSKLQDDITALKSALQKFSRHTMFFVAPLAMVFFVIAEPFFLLLLTEKWLPMVPYFQLLLIAGVIFPMHMVNVQVLSAQGKMKLNFNISLIKYSFTVINIIVMYRFGVIYIIYGEIFFSFLALIINCYYTKKLVGYGIIEQLKDVYVMLLSAILLVLVGLGISNLLENNYFKIIVPAFVVLSLYLFVIYFFEYPLFKSNLEIIRRRKSLN